MGRVYPKNKGSLYPNLNPRRPAPGYHERNDGALAYVGHHGASWSSSTTGYWGFYLWFHLGLLNPSGANARVYGFQLRCLSE